MNILLIGHEKGMNGASMSLINIIGVLEKDESNHIFVLTGSPDGPFREALKGHRAEVLVVPMRSWYEANKGRLYRVRKFLGYLVKGMVINHRAARIVAAYAKENRIDVIHSNSSVLAVGVLVSRMTGIPHVMHIREMRDIGLNFCPVFPEKWLAAARNRSTDAYLCVSKAVADHEVLLDEAKKRVIYNGIDRKNYLERGERKPGEPVRFLIAGRVSPGKGQDEAVKAAAILAGRGIAGFTLSIAGSGELSEPVPECVKDRVRLLGFIDDMPSVRQNMDVELVCSRAEAFGRITAEAMMGGMPVIGSDTGGTPELIREGETGFLYSYGDAEALADRMAYFISHPEKIGEMGRRAQAFALEHFTIERCVREITEVYREVTADHE
ncbi:MAG: glycosyltransferase family 4 protein [Lachnospiraceae bacterium]|nr:glycosyltransferase family 4 protein [Lachnospiraceae bacterium]